MPFKLDEIDSILFQVSKKLPARWLWGEYGLILGGGGLNFQGFLLTA